MRRSARCWVLFAAACGATASQPSGSTAPEYPEMASQPFAALPDGTPPSGLYSAEEALRDVLSGTWQYLGTGTWPGISRMHACGFRNDRVLVVNVYCSITEAPAFRLDVYSPSRGHVRIYAESKGPISAHPRPEYFTFVTQSEPPPGADAGLPPLALSMSFEELQRYDQKRYDAFLPVCYSGMEHSKPQNGCLGALAGRTPEWARGNRPFFEKANADWYRVIEQMRAQATKYGKDPEEK